MPRVIRIRPEDVQSWNGKAEITLPEDQEDFDVKVYYSAPCLVTLYVVSNEVVYPLHIGSQCDQTYNFDKSAKVLWLDPQDEAADFVYLVKVNGTNLKKRVDPIPDVVPVPLDDQSLQYRVMQAVNASLSAMGLNPSVSRGKTYSDNQDTDDNDDTDFGPGYQYDEQVEAEIDAAARATVLDRFTRRMQRSKSPGTTREPLLDERPSNDPEDRSADIERTARSLPERGRKPASRGSDA